MSIRPVASRAESILVGRLVGSIIDIGAAEFPPEIELSEPTSVTRSPSAPALLMPYMGLCGLLPVSLSERAQKIVPFTFARVAADVFDCMPRRNALSAWKAMPNSVFTWPAFPGVMSEGRPSFE